MIRLHTAATPNGRKAAIALEECGLDYEVKRVDLEGEEQLGEDFLRLNPNNKIPVLEDGDQVVWESGAILLHLGERYGEGVILPKDPARRLEAIQYAFFQSGGVGPNLGRLGQALRAPEAERSPHWIEVFRKEMERLVGVLERILSDGRDYLAGEYSIGDIMHMGWLDIPRRLGMQPVVSRPHLLAWLERMAARPAVQRGLAVPQ